MNQIAVYLDAHDVIAMTVLWIIVAVLFGWALWRGKR